MIQNHLFGDKRVAFGDLLYLMVCQIRIQLHFTLDHPTFVALVMAQKSDMADLQLTISVRFIQKDCCGMDIPAHCRLDTVANRHQGIKREGELLSWREIVAVGEINVLAVEPAVGGDIGIARVMGVSYRNGNTLRHRMCEIRIE